MDSIVNNSLSISIIVFYVLTLVFSVPEVAGTSCVSSLSQADCQLGEVLTFDDQNNCPSCQGGTGVCNDCTTESCAPGLRCERIPDSNQSWCGFDKSSCFHLLHMQNLAWTPSCRPDGSYAAKQCRGDKVSGRCFCFSSQGERIFGWDWRKNEDDMNCACSRRKAQLEQAGKQLVTLHCSQNGNFEELQCMEGICWCSDPEGMLQVDTIVLPKNMMEFLPCCK